MEVQKIQYKLERTYAEHYELEAVIERFYDSFPSSWGELVDVKVAKDSAVEDVYEAVAVMENGRQLQVEIFYAEDADDGEPWVCKALEKIGE
ncbi:hypothetical protein [Bacillus cereus]|uniref:hypothetical protein n=1 Tax=Bacillus cereus TaxID=1396 RepID=UPI00211E57C1|nr:hypothetical protein [Bacillus cereus]